MAGTKGQLSRQLSVDHDDDDKTYGGGPDVRHNQDPKVILLIQGAG